ncbi:hypothetical protein [Variovorax sp. JS1663]|uniref:hypothetical protein n=1 Tax=Variovorax sp. JS1663 TaxID=1851577 RepID=UPI000B34558F|nr:hypothetical protein [Variovorax sp. JS1663]OUM00755.1 hypothetical protein A8M77_19915 [Variovorax sp. JS1663]
MAKKPSEADNTSLEKARDAYNSYYREHVEHLVSTRDRERMSEVEVAAQIPDAKVRLEFVRRSINLTEANILHDTFYATPMTFNVAFGSYAIGTAVVLAAIAYFTSGYAVAAAVAFSYIFGYVHARDEAMSHFREFESHNRDVPFNKECNEEWELELKELRALSRDLQRAE